MIVSVEEAGEFDMIQRISEKKNREKKKSRSGGQESFEKLGIYGSWYHKENMTEWFVLLIRLQYIYIVH